MGGHRGEEKGVLKDKFLCDSTREGYRLRYKIFLTGLITETSHPNPLCKHYFINFNFSWNNILNFDYFGQNSGVEVKTTSMFPTFLLNHEKFSKNAFPGHSST